MFWLFLLFVLVPALELFLLIKIGAIIGAGNTFILILVTGAIGSYMAKTQGLSTWKNLNSKMSSGQMPGKELIDGAIILVAGALLLTPGVLTDVVGFLGLIPLTRGLLRGTLLSFAKRIPSVNVGMRFGSTFSQSTESETTVNSSDDVTLSGQARQSPRHTDSNLS